MGEPLPREERDARAGLPRARVVKSDD
jgi:hypothetical protein